MTHKQMTNYEDAKAQEYLKMLKKGEKVPSLDDFEFKGMEELEKFQSKAGKMMYDEDMILEEKWIKEERERRLKLREEQKASKTQSKLVSTDKTSILKSAKAKRSIEPLG